MSREKIRVTVVGLEFGAEFVPLYLHHPNVDRVIICDLDAARLQEVGERYAVAARTTDLDLILRSKEWDAVHLITPIPLHTAHTLAVLESGKHCACAVPMGMDLDDLQRIIATQRRVKKNYMMMETAVYSRAFLYVKALYEQGALGQLTFLRGTHYRDMVGWPRYWRGFPPHKYITHALAPLLALTNTHATKVHCLGSGQVEDELRQPYNNPYPLETALFRLEGTPVAAEVTRSMYKTARASTESFAVYGDHRSFEWQQLVDEEPLLFTLEPQPGRGSRITAERVQVPDRSDLLPPQIARFTQSGVYDATTPRGGFLFGGGHDGSHPHLVHEFVRSIMEQRPAAIDAVTAAQWTGAGICAHESAMQDGEGVSIPRFL